MPSVLSRRLPVKHKTDNKNSTPASTNSTGQDYHHDAAGFRRAVPAAPQLPANIFLNPNQPCFTQFFAHGQPPNGLRTTNLQNMRYICQQLPAHPGTYFYATMFDEGRGIPVYSAYVLNANNINFVAQQPGNWIQTNGIQHQGSDPLYHGGPCHKGHLFPAMTASGLPQNPQNPLNAANSARSTYQYTNAVPQCGAFNSGQWRVWEGRIRQFALQCTAAPTNGVMYLITGVSFVGVTSPTPAQPAQPPQPPQAVQVPITPFPNQPNPPVNPAAAIDQPNSMWTMGECVAQNGQSQSFAVIGNNVPVKAAMHTQQIPVAQLMTIIQDDIRINGLKRGTVKVKLDLFPGIKNSKDVELPKTEYPPPGNKEPSSETSSSSPQSPKPVSPKIPSSKPASPKKPGSPPSSPTKKKGKSG